MIRIAYVVHTFGIGGLERIVARLAGGLDPERFRAAVVCLDRAAGAEAWIEPAAVEIVELRKRPGNRPDVLWRLGRAFRRLEADIVHSHNWGTLLETQLAARLARRPRHVHAEHGTVLGTAELRGLRPRLRAAAMRWALRRADAVVAVTEATRERVSGWTGFPPGAVRVISNGVSGGFDPNGANDREAIRASIGVPPGALLLGSVGRLHPVKGFDLAIDAFARVATRLDRLHLALVGDGAERGRLEALARKRGLAGRVHFAGPQSDVSGWLSALDGFFNSSHSEGMSQALLEALAGGLPCLVTRVGAHGDIVEADGDPCGLVVPPGEPAAFAEALSAFVEDPARLEAWGRRARALHAERYSVEKMVAAYERLYEELCPDKAAATAAAPSVPSREA